MPRLTKFSASLPDLRKYILQTGKQVFMPFEVKKLYDYWYHQYKLPLYFHFQLFKSKLDENNILKPLSLEFPSIRDKMVFSTPDASFDQIASQLFSDSYLSHASALQVLGVAPATDMYVTHEQSPKLRPSMHQTLSQGSIDAAFRTQARRSNQKFKIGIHECTLLQGMYTDNLGVYTGSSKSNHGLRYTNVERTLIDIAVRPFYAGGAQHVLSSFSKAAQIYDVSVSRIEEYLTELDFIYPYHQCIGFYLEACGMIRESQLSILRKKFQPFRFYLEYGIEKPAFSEKWKIYYPSNLQTIERSNRFYL